MFLTTTEICHLVTGTSFLVIAFLLYRHLRVSQQLKLLPWSLPFLLTGGLSRLGEAAVGSAGQDIVMAIDIIAALVSLLSAAGLAHVLPQVTEERIQGTLYAISVSQEAQEFVDSLLPLAAFVCDADGGDLAINSAYRKLLGRNREEIRGYRYLAYVHPDDRAVAGDKWRAFCRGQINTYEETFRWHRPDDQISLRVQGGHRSNGQHYGIVTDLTDRIKHQRKLKEVADHALD